MQKHRDCLKKKTEVEIGLQCFLHNMRQLGPCFQEIVEIVLFHASWNKKPGSLLYKLFILLVSLKSD